MKTLKQLIEEHEHAKVVPMLAKSILWAAGIVLVGIVMFGVVRAIKGHTEHIGHIVEACQVLSLIAITVLGYHRYTGHRLFHELRHWNDPPTNHDSAYVPPDSSN